MAARMTRARTGVALRTLLFVPVPLLFLAGAISQFEITTRSYDLLYAAQLIESGKPLSVEYIDTLLETMDAADVPCRSDVVAAVMTTRFYTLDKLNSASTDPERWQTALAQSERLVTRGLTCFPSDGGLWLQLAIVRWASDAPTADVVAAMTRSQQLSPVETATLIGRLGMWNRLSRAALKAAEPAARADITAYETYFTALRPKALREPSAAVRELIASSRGALRAPKTNRQWQKP